MKNFTKAERDNVKNFTMSWQHKKEPPAKYTEYLVGGRKGLVRRFSSLG